MKRRANNYPSRKVLKLKRQHPCASLAFRLSIALLLCFALTFTGCFLTNEAETFYGRVNVPATPEFRWSDGGLPQIFDPAFAAAPPDTDAVRALFEGLTDYDSQTLAPVPGVATRWEASEDQRVWTFYLREDARWSNGERVTAKDFVRSWQRTLGLGSRAPHARLLENIYGATTDTLDPAQVDAGTASAAQTNRAEEKKGNAREAGKEAKPETADIKFGAEAISDTVLRVRLQQPDGNFPALVAHPIFRPVHEVREEDGVTALAQPVVSNGAFKLTQVGSDGVILERAVHYWDAQTVNLNRVRFVATRNAEEALEKYRAGEVDAVTNAGFEPLALKLLAPYRDFRRATFGALTYYKFNTNNAPFSDVRVREALAIAIDRERISEDGMDGASEPARTFLPAQQNASQASETNLSNAISLDIARAQRLLAEAGYPQGQNFPRVRLLVNRNEQQRQIAQSIAVMWRKSLGIETDVILKNWDEYEAAVLAGEFDVVRKGFVMQTMDEAANMRAMFEPETAIEESVSAGLALEDSTQKDIDASKTGQKNGNGNSLAETQSREPVLSERDALKELPAIPIYFASSYALVKPFVTGFDANLLDAPSLKRVKIDTGWQAPKKNNAVWFKVGE